MNNQNEPAYPVLDPSDYLGLTKMEAFTMAAMHGICANSDDRAVGLVAEERAEIAVKIAKATLAELEKAND